ncbi:MAG: COG1361 S-layer family protein [Nanoarchaeota archaeon]
MKQKIISCIFLVMLICMISISVHAESDTSVLSLSLINQDPDPAVAGDVIEVRIGIENKGGEAAENQVFEVIPEYPFSKLGSESLVKNVGTIAAYQYDTDMKIIKFKLRVDREATEGEYELDIKRYTQGYESVSVEKSFSIDIESKESAEIIYIDQIELIPGKITPLKFTINNVGSAPLRDLTFQWENAEDIILPVGSDNTKYVKYIDVGDSADLKFNVIASANADPDLYKLDLMLTYDDPATGETTEITTKAGVYVGGATDFDAAFSGVTSGEASFSISNIGSVSASSVTVRIPDQTGWRVSGSNSVIIGNLNEGDYTIASFTLQQSNRDFPGQTNAAGPNISDIAQRTQTTEDLKVKLEIIYTDSRGNRNTIEKEVPVDATAFRATTSTDGTAIAATNMNIRFRRTNPIQQAWNIGKWVILGVVLLTGFIFVRRKVKKERLKDPEYTYKQFFKDRFKSNKKRTNK